jgi:hypothetical protein
VGYFGARFAPQRKELTATGELRTERFAPPNPNLDEGLTMSTQVPQPAPPAPPAPRTAQDEVEIRIVSHSNLFYWWPVWAIGYILAILTWMDPYVMAVVPKGTEGFRAVEIDNPKTGKKEKVEALVVPLADKPEHQKHLPPADKLDEKPADPKLDISHQSTYGVVFAVVLLVVIVITNVPLRGMWSFMVIVLFILLITVLSLFKVWDDIFEILRPLDIRINMGGYVFISTGLLIVWLVTFVLFDRQMYMIFTPGQLRVRLEIGGGEKAFDTTGMTIEKQRSDLFRHWILGLGSGDLIVNTVGAHVQHFDLPNVLFIGKKVKQIEDMLREKAVVRGRA